MVDVRGETVENSTGVVIEYGFVIWSQNRKKGYKAQIIYNIPFDNRTNRIMNKQN